MQQHTGKRQFMCLREEFRSTFPWNHERLTRDGFRLWARTERKPPINIAPHHWRPLRDGKPVPRDVVEAFSEYISDRHILPDRDCFLSVIAEACDPPSTPKASAGGRQRPTWMIGWRGLYAHIVSYFRLEDEAYCRNEDDLMLAASMVMECVGNHEDKTLSGQSAIAHAESVMKRTLGEYARSLLIFWQANEHCVMFGTLRRGGTVERTGISVFVPLTEAFQRRFYAGLTDETEITATDLAHQSQYVLIQAIAENRSLDVRQDKAGRSLAMSRTGLYQCGSLFLPVHQAAWQPHIVSFGGTRESLKRLRAYGFEPTGTRTSLTGREIVEFAPPQREKLGLGYPLALAEYLAMKSLIQIYQAHIETQRLHLE